MASQALGDATAEAAPGGTDPASAGAPPNRRAALLRAGFIVGILFVVFVLILPQFVDYQEVLKAFQALTFPQFLLITALAIVGYLVSGLLFVAVIPGLSVLKGAACYLILSGIGASVPFGPWNMGVTWVVLRESGQPNRPATSGIALYGLISWLARVALPLVAVIDLALVGQLVRDNPAFSIAVISIVVFTVASLLIIGVVRSDRIANWLGRTGQRVSVWTLKRLGRSGAPDVEGSIHRFRDQVGEILRRRGAAALVVGVVAQMMWAAILVVALRMTGVPESALNPAQVFAVFSLVSVITIIPIAPGGAGVPELLFIAGLTSIAGSQYEAVITAGVFLYRLYNWFLPIPLAWILLKVLRRGRSMLPSTAELRSLATG
jgi:uncharacterized membrane protein YbhN (UPF0104 family)